MIPKYYGSFANNDYYYIIIEFINGNPIEKVKQYEKIKVIFELIMIISYLHKNKLIYRDFKPNNMLIDMNSTTILIDFDRIVDYKNGEDMDSTKDFASVFIAPELNENKNFSYSCDIYSLGLLIYYIMMGKLPNKKTDNSFEFDDLPNKYKNLQEICKKCTIIQPNKRPTILEIMNFFYVNYYSDIFMTKSFDNLMNSLNYDHTMKNNINYFLMAADSNLSDAQLKVANFYFSGQYLHQDIQKAVNFYTLAADLNHPVAQFILASLYKDGKHIPHDTDEMIHYYSLAADNDVPQAQSILGEFYLYGKYVRKDIKKAVYYLELAANKNEIKAQLNLGKYYLFGDQKDFKKAINYFTNPAEKNNQEAQYLLGLFYVKKI